MSRETLGGVRTFLKPFLRWRWLVLCLTVGAVLLGVAVVTEWKRHDEPDFLHQLATAAGYCFAIPFGIFLIVLLLRLLLLVGQLRGQVLRNLPNVLRFVTSNGIPLGPGESALHRLRGAVLEIGPGQTQRVNVVITERGLYVEFQLEKIPVALAGLFGRQPTGGQHVLRLPYAELASTRTQTRHESRYIWHTLHRKDGASLTLRLPNAVRLEAAIEPTTQGN